VLQVGSDFGELGESGLKILYDFRRNHIGIGQIGAVFEAFVFQPDDVEVEFVALC
jgi:hypothetical protein